MADVKPLKLVDQGGGAARLAEFEAGDTLPKGALPPLSAADVGGVAADDARLSDAREWSAETVAQAEAEGGTATTRRAWTAQRVRQAIVAWWNGVSSAWGRGFVASADAAAGRTALGLGSAATATVQSSNTDSTAGRLMSVGAFGLGTNAPPVVTDANLERLSGIKSGAGAAAINLPGSTGYGPLLTLTRSGGVITQIATYGSAAIEPELRVRGSADGGGSWGGFRSLYHTGNILGTVSQSGGVPTGAIIERGSNANGEFVKFADGTQEVICSATIDFSNFIGQLSSGVWTMTLNIPAVFSAGGLTVGSVSMLQVGYNSYANTFLSRMQVNVSTSGVPTLYRIDNTDMANSAVTREIRVLVRGRWY